MATLSSIDLRIAERLKDREFRRHWFRAILENNVPEQFRDLREARNMTQTGLAVAADMKQSAISRFESQRVASWKLETLLKMADALDAQLEILVVPAEQVIARHEREEAGIGWPSTSVVEVRSGNSREFNNIGGLTSMINPRRGPLRTAHESAHVPSPTSAAIGAEELARKSKTRWGDYRWN